MILVLVTAALALGLGLAIRGRLPAWSEVGVRGSALLGGSLAVRAISGLPLPRLPATVLLLGALALALAFLAANRRLTGAGLLAGGLAANAAVVVANGGMPVSGSALVRAGASADVLDAARADPSVLLLDEGTRLAWLADRFAFPVPAVAEVVSVGDVLVAGGLGLAIFTAVRAAGDRRAVAVSRPERQQEPAPPSP